MAMPTGTPTGDPSDVLRTELRPGDLGWIVHLHGVIYSAECGFDPTFEAYVAGPLADCVRAASPSDRIWLAERQGRVVGCIAIVAASAEVAQLRWFLVDPGARGRGLGKKLLHEAVAFATECGYKSIILWTVSALTTAARLYRSAGFEKVEQKPGRRWGVDVVEEKYELTLS
jgi:GNAT superfamily N-acetyltransferase